MRYVRNLCFLMVCMALLAAPAAADSVPEPDGYRMESYKAPVPATLKGAKVVSTEDHPLQTSRNTTTRSVCPFSAATDKQVSTISYLAE